MLRAHLGNLLQESLLAKMELLEDITTEVDVAEVVVAQQVAAEVRLQVPGAILVQQEYLAAALDLKFKIP
jgi:hypothetical protein